MNSDTGEVRTQGELADLFKRKPEEKGNWFSIDRKPKDDCDACEGEGFIGRNFNGKVIPCICVFNNANTWETSVRLQRDLKRKIPDTILCDLRSLEGGQER